MVWVVLLAGAGRLSAQRPESNLDGPVIPPGNEERVGRIVGLGERSVAGCTVARVHIESHAVVAAYECGGRTVDVRLVHPGSTRAASGAVLALVAPGAPATLAAELRRRLSEDGSGFVWASAPRTGTPPRFLAVEPTVPGAVADADAPSDPARDAAYSHGLDLYRRGRFEEALVLYVGLARHDPHDGILGMVVAALASTRPDAERVALLAREADAAPEDPLAQFEAGVGAHYYAHQQGRDAQEKRRYYEHALRYLDRARPAYDFEPRLFIYLAVSHFRLSHQAEAEELIERAVELGGDDPDAYYCRAEIFQHHDLTRSIADLDRYLGMTTRLREEGSVVSESKLERVRAMLDHLRAVERGEVDRTEMFDPADGNTPWSRVGAEPAWFALGTLSIAALLSAVFALSWWRRRRGAG